MRRTARPLTGVTGRSALTGAALAVAAVGLLAAPAHAVQPRDASAGDLELYPSSVAPGAQVTANTAACDEEDTVRGDASAVGAGRFTLTPSTHERDAVGQFQVPPSAQPGTYQIVATCAGGDRRVAGDLLVTLTPESQQVHPRGSVKTGVGGALGHDPVQTAAGVTALAVAAAGGTWLLHRRARGDGI
ncbi:MULTISPECIES: hypothetical protein [unclassified Streptomyces]|uniref:hypothetical protein n=1 Tax=unclassified Streptomyces TaxID=2593676 RepID=UPI000F6ED22D|nr:MULTISPECIES: hypothetical protein [unclassified Streptomyces]AZM62441.1 hypothetical protein DLM49_25505 [Streptomyces sp. WAC 01438]RSM93532.1 hypothetical protein DMA10_21300 [Streptomyces sp. WAC 01420]